MVLDMRALTYRAVQEYPAAVADLTLAIDAAIEGARGEYYFHRAQCYTGAAHMYCGWGGNGVGITS